MGLDGKQWLSLVFWQYPDLIQLWAMWDSQWMKFADLDEPKLGHWHHVCLEVSPANGELSAFMNGSDMGRVSAIWWSLCQDMVGEWWARSTTCLGVTVKVGVGVVLVPGR